MKFSMFQEDEDELPEPINGPNLFGFETSVMRRTSFSSGVRFCLLLCLICVLVGGIAILGIGIWTNEAEYGSKQLSTLIGVVLYRIDSFILMTGGGAIIVLTLFGLCGVLIPYKCLLGLHLGLLSFMSVMLFVAGILGYVLVSELEDKVKHTMESYLIQDYGVDIVENRHNRIITDSWDNVQQVFHCCGVSGDANSTTSWALYKEKSTWFKNNISRGSYIPESCCKSVNLEQCMGIVDVLGQPPRHGPPVPANASQWNYTMYTVGCFDKLESHLRSTGIVIGTAAITVAVFMLVELALSICMYRMLR